MIGRRVLGLLVAVAVSGGLLAAHAMAAKDCKTLCKDATCKASAYVCTGLKKAEKKACNKIRSKQLKACKKVLKVCKKAKDKPDVCSPSGAFID